MRKTVLLKKKSRYAASSGKDALSYRQTGYFEDFQRQECFFLAEPYFASSSTVDFSKGQ